MKPMGAECAHRKGYAIDKGCSMLLTHCVATIELPHTLLPLCRAAQDHIAHFVHLRPISGPYVLATGHALVV